MRTRSVSMAVQRGRLDIHLDGSGENFLAEEHITLFGWKALQVNLDRLLDIRDRSFECQAL